MARPFYLYLTLWFNYMLIWALVISYQSVKFNMSISSAIKDWRGSIVFVQSVYYTQLNRIINISLFHTFCWIMESLYWLSEHIKVKCVYLFMLTFIMVNQINKLQLGAFYPLKCGVFRNFTNIRRVTTSLTSGERAVNTLNLYSLEL